MQIYVVDNNSEDGSVEIIKNAFPQVKLIENKTNIGFAQANNQAISQAKGRYVLILNPDTLFLDASLKKMVDFIDNHPEIGMIGPKLLNSDKETIQYWCARKLPNLLDVFFEYTKLSKLFPHNRLFGRHLMSYWDHNDSHAVECISGACMLIRNEVLEMVGSFDENYPLFTEDTDLCHRIHTANWKIFYFAEAQIMHFGGQSTSKLRGPSTIKSVQGTYRYFSKYYNIPSVIMLWLLILSASIAKVIAWAFLLLIVKDRKTAFNQIKTYMKICTLVPLMGRNIINNTKTQ